MKLNMWLIAERLEKHSLKCDIKDGASVIESIRFIPDGKAEDFDERYVYLCLDNNMSLSPGASNEITLINGRDIIVIYSNDANEILNEVLATFDYYNKWEASLWELSSHKSFQAVLDKAGEALQNPMVLADINGDVLAMSSEYKDDDINEFWVETRDTGHIPATVLGFPFRNKAGAAVSWKDQPDIYYTPHGTKIIGCYPSRDGEAVAGFSLWEYKNKITPGHVWLVKILCDIFLSMSVSKETGTPIRSRASILLDLLNGVHIDDNLLQKLEIACQRPWSLIVVKKIYQNQNNKFALQSLLTRMRETGIPCIPLVYNEYVVCLVNSAEADRLLDKVIGSAEKYYCTALSMPFENLSEIAERFRQTEFAMTREAFRPGKYYAMDHALGFLVSSILETGLAQILVHPALNTLKKYDKENDGELYETLYYYLLYERSILQGAEAIHIHRNSFLYRIKRIGALIDADLEDPFIRSYLLFSYFIDKGLM